MWFSAAEGVVDRGLVQGIEGRRAARGQGGQDVRVSPCGWPRHSLPALSERGWRTAAALTVRAGRALPCRRLPAAEPAGVLERHAEGDGESPVGPWTDLGDAEVRARRGIGILAVGREGVDGPEYLAPGP